PPAERLEALGATCLLDDSPEPRLAQEAHRETRPVDSGERRMEREEHPRAVSGDAVGGPGAAMGDGGEPRERTVDELPRRPAARVGDEADPAGVAVDGGVVEGLAHE